MIRITGGRLRGRSVESPPRSKDIRPTTSLMRESIFNSLQARVSGARFLDIFAGSGIMGLEALSRGAVFVLAVEKDPRQAQAIRQAYEKMKITEEEGLVLAMDAEAFLSKTNRKAPFELCFLDPPYGFRRLEELISLLQTNGWMAEGGLILTEHGSREPDLPNATRKMFGDSSLSFIQL